MAKVSQVKDLKDLRYSDLFTVVWVALVIAWCVVQSIAAPVAFGQIFQLVPPVMLITMLPISIAGWGVREATMGLAFGYAGLMTNEGINISLLYGAVSMEVFGHLGFALDDPAPMFELTLGDLAALVGLEYPLPAA